MHDEASRFCEEALANTNVLRVIDLDLFSSEDHFSLRSLESTAAGMGLVKRGL